MVTPYIYFSQNFQSIAHLSLGCSGCGESRWIECQKNVLSKNVIAFGIKFFIKLQHKVEHLAG